MVKLTRRNTLALAGLLVNTDWTDRWTEGRRGADDADGGHGGDEDGRDPRLTRVATTVLGAEITGLCLSPTGHLFFNVQHPDDDNPEPYDRGGVGAVEGVSLYDVPRDFPSVPVPEDDDREVVHTAVGTYRVLMNGGDPIDGGNNGNDDGNDGNDGEAFGIAYSPEGEALSDGSLPDFNGFVPSATAPDEGYLFTNWESRPGAISRLHLRLGPDNRWTILGSMNVDFRAVEGTWGNCFGSVTPWNTPLSAEENFSAALTPRWNDPDWDRGDDEDGDEVANLADYLGYHPNPYRYGYMVEVANPTTDEPTPVKRFAMGRFAHETAVVMADERTVYLTDDGSAKSFYKFVADTPGELGAGTLYAAKAGQDDGDDTATVGFDIEWLELASGTDAEIESWIAEYDGIDYGDYEEDETSYITDEEVEAWADGDADDDRVAFLETMTAAEERGATTEFRKMEGINVAPGAGPGDYVYVSMSKIDATMADDEGDVQLEGNDYGAVYRLQLGEDYDVDRLEPVITGGPEANICGGCPYDAAPDTGDVCTDCGFNPLNEDSPDLGTRLLGEGESVDPENTLANPDNIVVLKDGRVLVGEDTSEHENNMIWLYDPASE